MKSKPCSCGRYDIDRSDLVSINGSLLTIHTEKRCNSLKRLGHPNQTESLKDKTGKRSIVIL